MGERGGVKTEQEEHVGVLACVSEKKENDTKERSDRRNAKKERDKACEEDRAECPYKATQ